MPVLLIIDMQVGMTWPASGARNNPQAESHIARLLDSWRRAGAPVVHVRHISRTPGSPFWPGQAGVEFQPALAPLDSWRRAGAPVVHVRHISRTPGSPFWPGQAGVEFQPALAPLDSEHVVEKNVPDAFTHSGLERWLHARGQRELVIAGVSTNNSVEATARSAGNLGFKTHVVADACFAFGKTDLRGVDHPAEEVHQMALANLQGEYASVIETPAAIALLAR